jgi:hypothetical protein
MGLLSDTTVYLAGAVEHSNNATSWRDEYTEFLDTLGIHVYNPLKPPSWTTYATFNHRDIYKAIAGLKSGLSRPQAFTAQKECRAVCKRLAYACDWVICRFPKEFTVGTIDELTIAERCGKPILFWVDEAIPSSWAAFFTCDTVEELDDYFFKSNEELRKHIQTIDSGGVSLDPLRWIFLSKGERP